MEHVQQQQSHIHYDHLKQDGLPSLLGPDRPPLVYDDCGKLQLPEALRLQLHGLRARMQQGKPDHLCPLCARPCGSFQHLDDHILGVHWKVPRYQCNKCGNPYRYRGDFARHVKKCVIGLTSDIRPSEPL